MGAVQALLGGSKAMAPQGVVAQIRRQETATRKRGPVLKKAAMERREAPAFLKRKRG
jgi:hypothetical protein